MATQSTISDDLVALNNHVDTLLKPYERSKIEFVAFYPYYMFTLKTDVMVHRKHTRKGLFTHHSVASHVSMTGKPSKELLGDWLESARERNQNLIQSGEYETEELISGQFQPIKRKFNQWIYYDTKSRATIGEMQGTDMQVDDSKPSTGTIRRPNHKPKGK